MRLIFDMPNKVARGLLNYIATADTETEVTVKVRLVPRGKNQMPDILWEVEFLPNSGGVYRMLLQGGRK